MHMGEAILVEGLTYVLRKVARRLIERPYGQNEMVLVEFPCQTSCDLPRG